MALNLNHVVVAGHLTRDPQVKVLPSERSVAEFGLAVNRRFKSADGEYKEESTFLDIEAWGRTAELVGQYLAKGSPLYVEGRLRLDTWQDKDGNRRTKVKIIAESVHFIGPKRDGARAQPAQPAVEAETAKEAPPF